MGRTQADLVVMTMNLRFGLADDGDNGWVHRKSVVRQILGQYPAQFIGFQEVNHFQAEFLIKNLPSHNYVGWHNRGIKWWQSIMIFYDRSWTCLAHKHYFLSETPEIPSKLEGSKWPRQCVIGWFRAPARGQAESQAESREFIMVNTHFDFAPQVQKDSAALIMGFLSDFPRGLPLVITGDFNANPGSPAYEFFLRNGFKEVFSNEAITTFHEFEGKETGRQIDWILFREGLAPDSPKVIKDSFSGRFPSDHYPLMCGFRWQGTKILKGE